MNNYKDWHNLTERAGVLHEKITERIYYEGLHFCRNCAENGRYCGIADLTMEEKEKLIGIRDSLKDVHNMLLFFQTLESRQQRHYNGAVARLEESRMLLIERLDKYPKYGTKLDVIEELRHCLCEGKTVSLSGKYMTEMKEKQSENEKEMKNSSSNNFLVICIRSLFNPWNWFRTTRIAVMALLVVSPVNFYRNRLQNSNKMPVSRLKIGYSDYQFDVSCGKG